MTVNRRCGVRAFAGTRVAVEVVPPPAVIAAGGAGAVAACGPERRPSMRLVLVVRLTLLTRVRFRSRCRALPALPSMSLLTAGLGNISTSGYCASHASPQEKPVGTVTHYLATARLGV